MKRGEQLVYFCGIIQACWESIVNIAAIFHPWWLLVLYAIVFSEQNKGQGKLGQTTGIIYSDIFSTTNNPFEIIR
jgi:hypothetical protein